MLLRLEKRLTPNPSLIYILPITATFLALIFCAIFLQLTGKDFVLVYKEMFVGALGTEYGLSEVIVKMIPLCMCALGVAIAFRMQLWNIGAEGQFYMGALLAAYLPIHYPNMPAIIMLPAMAILSLLAGGCWGAITGFLRNKWKVNEIISTLMLNYIAILTMDYFVYGPWRDPNGMNFPLTAPFPDSVMLPTFGSTRIHAGVFVLLAIVVFLSFIFKNSKWGYKTKVIGLNPVAANYAGLNIPANVLLVMFLSGALSGLAGMIEVSGVVGKLQPSLSPGYGYTAIIIAWLARLNPFAILVVGFFFAVIQVGGFMVQTLGINSSIATMIQGAILFFVIGSDIFNDYRLVRIKTKSEVKS